MSPISHPMRRRARHAQPAMIAAAAALALSACQEPPAVNPWREDSIPASAWTTPSRQGIEAMAAASGSAPVLRTRDVEPAVLHPPAGVPHYPLWWEDPFEDKGDGDGLFAWTYADYLAMPYGLGRFIVNTSGWPVSAVVTPPGTAMVSDSVVGRDHDAAPGRSPDPAGDASDFGR